jgi:ABC-type bacteriocin/lantibiotic exporter with double-glycine peptidase domain
MKIISKIFNILSPTERKKALYLLGLIFFSALLEMLGVASIIPFITLVLNPNLVETNYILNIFYQSSRSVGVININQFLFLMGLGVFFIFLLTLTTRGIVQYAQIRFSLAREYSISKRLFESYLQKPYKWFLDNHSANISKIILSDVQNVVTGIIMPVLTIITQGLVILTLVVLLILVDPILAISTALFLGIIYSGISYYVKKKQYFFGSEFYQANKDRFKVVTETLSAIKEIKVWGVEKFYIDKFEKPSKIYSNAQSSATIFSYLPRYLIEGVAFGGVIILIIFLIARGDNFIKMTTIIAVYVFAGYRLMPALQSIYVSFSQIRFSRDTLDNLHNDLFNLKFLSNFQHKPRQLVFKKSITLKNINFNYSNTNIKQLKNINLTIPAFGMVGIIGKSGSGKTTLIDIILGLLEANSGSLVIDRNININKHNIRSWQRNIAYVPQKIYLSENGIASNIAFGEDERNINIDTIKNSANIADIHNFITKELSAQYSTGIGELGKRLSGGQIQRIGIARAIYRKPRVLILDEATNALDSSAEEKIIKSLKKFEKNTLIILVTHRLNFIKRFKKIFLMEKGEIVAQGSYNQLIKSKNKNFHQLNNSF